MSLKIAKRGAISPFIVMEVMRAAAEREAATLYREAYGFCDKVGDYVSKELFMELLRDEEGHIDFLETQLGLYDRLGTQHYEHLNAEPANEADSEDGGQGKD